MLVDNYNPTSKLPNHSPLSRNHETTFTWGGFILPTTSPDIFTPYTAGELRAMFDKQEEEAKRQLEILTSYHLITPKAAKATRDQYRALYFQDGYVYKKDLLISLQQSYTLPSPVPTPPPHRANPLGFTTDIEEDEEEDILDDDPRPPHSITNTDNQSNVLTISRSAIRAITGYSYVVQMDWHTSPQEITWQKDLIESTENIVAVDGSRQGGKSLTIAELLIEESYVPGKDILVAAFLQDTTDAIGQYMLEFIERINDVDPDTFIIKERKRYIQNNKSGVRIHFRTLQDGAKGIRGKTFRMIVVDEAMLVKTTIFQSILLPTQTTIANPRVILLGTAQENKNCYMYQIATEIKKGVYLRPDSPLTAKYIKFSIHDNPLASPAKRADILMHADDPDIQREFLNVWGKLGDSLLSPTIPPTTIITDLSPHGIILIGIDPARKQDRSGYSVAHIINGVITIVQSGEVPPAFKEDWTLQKKFFMNLAQIYQRTYQVVHVCMDYTGVGDGVYIIFTTGQEKLPLFSAIKYTSGNTDSEQDQQRRLYNVGKTLLINNTIDMFEQKIVLIPRGPNDLLLEEIDHIEIEKSDRSENLILKTDFYDDIYNSLMVILYVARKTKLINKVYIAPEDKPPTLQDAYAPYLRNRSPQGQSQMW